MTGNPRQFYKLYTDLCDFIENYNESHKNKLEINLEEEPTSMGVWHSLDVKWIGDEHVIFDAIYGHGSYGYKEGTLEIQGLTMIEETQDSGILGHLTAEQVMERFRKEIKEANKE